MSLQTSRILRYSAFFIVGLLAGIFLVGRESWSTGKAQVPIVESWDGVFFIGREVDIGTSRIEAAVKQEAAALRERGLDCRRLYYELLTDPFDRSVSQRARMGCLVNARPLAAPDFQIQQIDKSEFLKIEVENLLQWPVAYGAAVSWAAKNNRRLSRPIFSVFEFDTLFSFKTMFYFTLDTPSE